MNNGYRTLSHVEKVYVDSELLSDMATKMGEVGADQKVTQAMEKSMSCLCSIQKAVSLGKMDDLIRLSHELTVIAGNVGMTSYANVAADVHQCAVDGNSVALSATLARLHRIGDRSIMAVWGLEDVSV